MRTRRNKFSIFIAMLVMLVTIVSTQLITFANSTEYGSLTINCKYDGKSITNEQFGLYEIGYIDEIGKLQILETYKNYALDFSSFNEDDMQDLAETLNAYIQRDNVAPTLVSQTDENGILVFDDLKINPNGVIYLVACESYDNQEIKYTCKPFFVTLPETENGEVLYEATVNPKLKIYDEENVSVKVVKIWEDNNLQNIRPDSIEVQLLRNGKIYATQELNQKNNWRYTWEDLDSSANWSVVEKDVPDSYTVKTSTDGDVYTITNTLKSSVVQASLTQTPRNIFNDKLPRTGLYWLPVIALALAGCLFLIIGIFNNSNDDSRYNLASNGIRVK